MEQKKTIERSVEIAAPASVVFAFLADIRNMPKWLVAIKKIWDTSQDDPGLGVTYRWQYGFLGVTLVGTGECICYEKPTRVVFRTAGDSEGNWVVTLEERNGRTHLQIAITYTIQERILARFKGAAQGVAATRDIEHAVKAIKLLCEQGENDEK